MQRRPQRVSLLRRVNELNHVEQLKLISYYHQTKLMWMRSFSGFKLNLCNFFIEIKLNFCGQTVENDFRAKLEMNSPVWQQNTKMKTAEIMLRNHSHTVVLHWDDSDDKMSNRKLFDFFIRWEKDNLLKLSVAGVFYQ